MTNSEKMINVTRADLPELKNYTEYLKKIWANHWLTNDGELVQSLRQELKTYLKIDDLVLVSNGTLAIQLALKALDLKGEVITTPFTFAATTNALLWEGLKPVFADIDKETFNIDPYDIERKITSKTCAILAVHVYGNPCFIERMQEVADSHNLKMIYDAAHAFGVEYKNCPITNFGDVSTLSFHATKVFNTIEGGAVIARDECVVKKLMLLRNHGIKSEQEVVLPGTNAKMNEFQAAMGLCNLEYIDRAIDLRKMLYQRYLERFASLPVGFQKIVASKYNFSYMPILLRSETERDSIYSLLTANGIKPRKYFFPLTVNFDYFKNANVDLIKKYNLVNAKDIANRILCLPLYPNLENLCVDQIVSLVSKKIRN